MLGAVQEIHQGVEVVVPVGDDREQRQRREDRLGERHVDPVHDLQVVVTVDLGGVLQARRDLLIEGAKHHDEEHVVELRRDDPRPRVVKAERLDQQKGGDQPSREQQRKGDEEGDRPPEHQVALRQWVGGQRDQHQVGCGAGTRIEDGVAVASQQHGIAHGYPVGGEIDVNRDHADRACDHAHAAAHRCRRDVEQRVEEGDAQGDHEQVVAGVEQAVAGCAAHLSTDLAERPHHQMPIAV